MNSTYKEDFDILRSKYTLNEQRKYIQAMIDRGIFITAVDEPWYVNAVREFVTIVTPCTANGIKKIRIGGANDGGYVMLDPGDGGIAYSLGVSSYSPWDLEMAERNFRVYQYDGSIDAEPDTHKNIFFNKYYVGSTGCENENCKTIKQIITENNHQDEKNIIAQIDIEGAEWDLFDAMDAQDILRFKQIVIEFHRVHTFEHTYKILRKINETHTPVHIHYNNVSTPNLILPDAFLYNGHHMEITYARTKDYTFSPCTDYFPTPLDMPNLPDRPDIPIGYFDLLRDFPL